MKLYKTKQVPAYESRTLDKVICDFCKTEIRYENFSAEEVQIRHKVGNNYPEGGSGTETTVDMCGKCFNEKLLPWIEEQGVVPSISEWDY